MKLSPRSYAIFWDAHAWAGAVASIILFAVFFLGAFALFAEELAPWQEQAFRAPVAATDDEALAVAQRVAEREAIARPGWFGISLPTDEEPWLRIWRLGDGGSLAYSFVDPRSGESFEQRSDLGDFLNQMHFLEPIPYGQLVAGLASLVLLFLAGTGLLLQLGSVVKELLQFRPHVGRRRVFWSDAHKVVGVISLPFFLLFGLSGAILCLDPSLRPAVVASLFDGDDAAMSDVTEWPRIPGPTGVDAPAPDLRAAYRIATERYPNALHRWFFIANLGDENTVIDLPGEQDGRIAPFTNVRLARDGSLLWARDAGGDNLYAGAAATLYGLHFASFAKLGGKAVYALLAMLASFGILSGNLLWIERRRIKRLGRFDRILAKLTSGGCAGLPLAVAAIFLANQLLPLGADGRVGLEKLVFFAAWGGALAYAFARGKAAESARHLLFAAGALFLVVPLLDALRTGRLPFDPRAPWLLATEGGLVLLGCLVLACAVAIARLERQAPVRANLQKVAAPDRAAAA